PRPEAGEGRYYWTDLVGLEVVNEQGVVLGELDPDHLAGVRASLPALAHRKLAV
ncbi:MAG: hypothetical protein RLZZ20_2470, partial [Pseudomonadota bacterium]